MAARHSVIDCRTFVLSYFLGTLVPLSLTPPLKWLRKLNSFLRDFCPVTHFEPRFKPCDGQATFSFRRPRKGCRATPLWVAGIVGNGYGIRAPTEMNVVVDVGTALGINPRRPGSPRPPARWPPASAASPLRSPPGGPRASRS